MEEALLGRREEWDAGPAEGLVFVRTRDAGKSGGREVGQEVCGGGPPVLQLLLFL